VREPREPTTGTAMPGMGGCEGGGPFRPSARPSGIQTSRKPRRRPGAGLGDCVAEEIVADLSKDPRHDHAGSFPIHDVLAGTHVETKLDEEVYFGELEWPDERHHRMRLRDGSDEYGPVAAEPDDVPSSRSAPRAAMGTGPSDTSMEGALAA
jgi:hypothetical protein